MTIEHTDEIFNDSFGLWISSLFSAISGRNPGIGFDEQKQAFFFLLEKWLEEGKIRFCRPDDPLNQVWETDSNQIINYLKERWPTDACDEQDSDLNLYFYEIPAILWVDSTGKLHGS